MNTIWIVGYSVTVQTPGFVDLIQSRAGYEVKRFGVGGANMHSILYMLNKIDFKENDICLLELSTSWRWLGADFDRYLKLSTHIFKFIKNKSVRIGVLDFSRKDVIQEDDLLHRAILNAASSLQIPFRSLYFDSPTVDEYLFDGIHPKQAGCLMYADCANQLISELINVPSEMTRYEFEFNPLVFYINECSCNADGELFINSFERSGIDLDYIDLKAGSMVDIHFNNEFYLIGLLLVIGPFSGRIVVSVDGKEHCNTLAYDERCYYDRLHPLFFNSQQLSHFSIKSIQENVRPKLVKGEIYDGVQSVRVAGVYASDVKPKY